MERYDDRKELAPRDVVARAIDDQVKHSHLLLFWGGTGRKKKVS